MKNVAQLLGLVWFSVEYGLAVAFADICIHRLWHNRHSLGPHCLGNPFYSGAYELRHICPQMCLNSYTFVSSRQLFSTQKSPKRNLINVHANEYLPQEIRASEIWGKLKLLKPCVRNTSTLIIGNGNFRCEICTQGISGMLSYLYFINEYYNHT